MAEIRVAVMNTSKEITDILQEVLKEEGFLVCTTYTYLLKERKERFNTFIKDNKPDVIVYDIAIPYQENYNLFKDLSEEPIAKNIAFVLTTTNKSVLENLVGSTHAIEIVGKPYDLQILLKSVKDAFARISSKI